MQPNATGFRWSGKKLRAVEFVAQDALPDVEIAREVGVNKTTLERWKRNPVFAERVNEAKRAIAAAVRAEGIANKQNRIDAANARWLDLETIRKERGEDPHIASFPGGKTGFVAVDIKLVKVVDDTGDEGTEISYKEFWVHSFDNSLFKAYLDIEKQVAQETGQWEEKINQTGEVLQRSIVIIQGDTSEPTRETAE